MDASLPPKSDTAVAFAAYNADATIIESVESILNGSLAVDVYIADDNSKRPVTETLAAYADRVRIIRLDRNLGCAGARNAALKSIMAHDYKYIAIMDADDIAYPARLEKQHSFLQSNPEIAVCGTWCREFDGPTNTTLRIFKRPAKPADIRNALFFNTVIGHPTAMYRASVLRELGIYDEKFPAAEDYELMRRISQKYPLANIEECLLDYRIGGVSQQRRFKQLVDRLKIQALYFEPLNWRAWAGMCKTLVLMVTSDRVVLPMKWSLAKLSGNAGNSSRPAI